MQKYKRVKKVSQGAFGTVYEFQNLSPSQKIPDPTVAIKQLYSSSANVKRELQILQDLPQHQNLLKIFEIINDKFHVNIVMQLGRYDLASFIDQVQYPLRQRQVKKIAYQVLNGLKILHQKEYIHRDLKPGNIIISKEGILKLCDFGSAVKCTKGEQYELEGFTRWYKAPEMLYGCRNYKYEVDVWSLGCILMQVATGQPYFDGKSQIEQLSLITRQLGNPTEENWPSLTKLPDFGKITFKQMQEKTIHQIAEQRWVSKELCAFIKKMIRYEGRSTVQELLNDPYLKEINLENSALTIPNGEQEKCSIEVKTSYQTLKKLVKDQLKKC